MNDKFFSYLSCILCFGCIVVLNVAIFLCSALLHIRDLILTVCIGTYYFIIGIVYLGLFSLIIKNSFDHVDEIILHKTSKEIKDFVFIGKSRNTEKIFKHILLNLVFIFFSVILNYYFDIFLMKVPIVIYVCWTLGFTASFPINKDLSMKLNNNNLKEYILSKSIINTFIFIIIYFSMKNVFEWI